MSEAPLLDDPPVTVAAFDAFLATQGDMRSWELVAGRIIDAPGQRLRGL